MCNINLGTEVMWFKGFLALLSRHVCSAFVFLARLAWPSYSMTSVLVFENMFLNSSILRLTSLNKDICAVLLEPASVCLHSSRKSGCISSHRRCLTSEPLQRKEARGCGHLIPLSPLQPFRCSHAVDPLQIYSCFNVTSLVLPVLIYRLINTSTTTAIQTRQK